MSEYWKSTPQHWCKFCHAYVRDTPLERKNHDASGKHQNNIQRSLRELHKGKEREEREKQRAKNEVARLNGLVAGGQKTAGSGGILGAPTITPSSAPPPRNIDAAAQRKAHAEQLAALGVQLPEALKREVTGVGGWETVSTRVVEEESAGPRSLADIIKLEREAKGDVNVVGRGVRKRKAEDGDEEDEVRHEQEAAPKKHAAWGSRVKTYPGQDADDGGDEDLEVLLSGISKKKEAAEVKKEEDAEVKTEESPTSSKPIAAFPDVDSPGTAEVKQEEDESNHAPPPIVFKKRKVRR